MRRKQDFIDVKEIFQRFCVVVVFFAGKIQFPWTDWRRWKCWQLSWLILIKNSWHLDWRNIQIDWKLLAEIDDWQKMTFGRFSARASVKVTKNFPRTFCEKRTNRIACSVHYSLPHPWTVYGTENWASKRTSQQAEPRGVCGSQMHSKTFNYRSL